MPNVEAHKSDKNKLKSNTEDKINMQHQIFSVFKF